MENTKETAEDREHDALVDNLAARLDLNETERNQLSMVISLRELRYVSFSTAWRIVTEATK